MASPAIVILLHTHMPYVRRNGDWPVGEEWLLEAWAESYLPIWKIVEDLTAGVLPGRLCLTLTPILAEQLQDAYMEERLDWYLKNKIEHTRLEMERLEAMGDEPRKALAAYFGDLYRGLLADFDARFRGRMMRVLRSGMDAGAVEVLASAATHAHLPSLGSQGCVKAQIEIGIESYRRCFGRDPRGFWLPECSYTPDLDGVLAAFSPPLQYVVLDFTAPDATAAEAHTWEPRRLGSTPLMALLRDRTAHELVWTLRGYPSGGDYREFAKRDHDGWGFQYWRVTSGHTPLDEKDIYYPDRAEMQAREHAGDFAARLERRAAEAMATSAGTGTAPVLLAAYDTELMGHWWKEGPSWLREVLSRLGGAALLPHQVAEEAVAAELPAISPPMTAWNVDGTFSTWVNPGTAAIWTETRAMEEDLLRRIAGGGSGAEEGRALLQAARELLLAEASDWTFMITRDAAASYARDRFEAHCSRYLAITDMLDRGGMDIPSLASLEDTDNPFPWLSLQSWL
ncbi:MAG: 1,4-alpha-glucan branching protein domain-containing protein [Actinomycetota bacterium]